MSYVDWLDGLVGYLRAHPDVAPLAGARIYPAELPADEAVDMPRYAVVMEPMGGKGPASAARDLRPRVDITCYGATPKQSRMLWLAVADALQELNRATFANSLLHNALLLAGPIQTRHPETHWPLTWGSWQVTVGADTV
jgi:hypothetical protein